MKNISIYIDSEFNGSGGTQYTKALLNAFINLSSNKLSKTVIYTSKDWKNYLNKLPNINLVYLDKSKYLNRLYQILITIGCYSIAKFIAHIFDRNLKYIENQYFDFIIFPAGDTLACLVNSKVISTIHDLMHRYERKFKESGSFFRYHFRENYYKNLLLSSSVVLVDSNLGRNQVLESYKQIQSKIFILPYIAPDYVYSQEIENQVNSTLTVISEKYLFYPAVFWPHKNHINLIKAINILNERGQLINLLLAGKERNEYKKLQKFVNQNNLEKQVKFIGYIPDKEIINLYKNAYAMVMPTFYGPTNIPPIEAILLNCPPIVSNKYGMPEQFEDAALYFDPNSPIEIADAIESLLTNNQLRSNLVKNGNKLKEKFTQKRFESDLLKIIQDLD
jgi:glycosyltransferase involved in cell wall biosynthesis